MGGNTICWTRRVEARYSGQSSAPPHISKPHQRRKKNRLSERNNLPTSKESLVVPCHHLVEMTASTADKTVCFFEDNQHKMIHELKVYITRNI
ncbi:hypothetical protein NPIL_192231 [Nephila pilipes]|uniref:Uncharacterized protein n=1 Tax=Nephila pilipes TaxID=299642 RepID=A0A8X6R6X9_NEPPI|nr:hypothetical protein NPIL_192231 [Nephila pilipes]